MLSFLITSSSCKIFLKYFFASFNAQTVAKALNPFEVSINPPNLTTKIGGVSTIVTSSITSFLCNLDPGLSISLKIYVISALYPAKAIR